MDFTNGEFEVTGANATANIFASYPAKHLSVVNGFVDQVGPNTDLSEQIVRQHNKCNCRDSDSSYS